MRCRTRNVLHIVRFWTDWVADRLGAFDYWIIFIWHWQHCVPYTFRGWQNAHFII